MRNSPLVRRGIPWFALRIKLRPREEPVNVGSTERLLDFIGARLHRTIRSVIPALAITGAIEEAKRGEVLGGLPTCKSCKLAGPPVYEPASLPASDSTVRYSVISFRYARHSANWIVSECSVTWEESKADGQLISLREPHGSAARAIWKKLGI